MEIRYYAARRHEGRYLVFAEYCKSRDCKCWKGSKVGNFPVTASGYEGALASCSRENGRLARRNA